MMNNFLLAREHHYMFQLPCICGLHPLFSTEKNALQIIGYYDELEVVNPIGSYVSRHKLCCLFFTIGNIQPQ